MDKEYIPFTKEMKKTHTILVPNMLPTHFKLVMKVLGGYGYKSELLESSGPCITELGLKYVHNDTCYPALLVIGQFLDAIINRGYDPHKVALILFQTGGGCRASNYISLLRKALKKAGYGYVPVIPLAFNALEKHPGFTLSPSVIYKMIYAVVFGDIIANLKNQCKPYEIYKGDTDNLVEMYTTKITGAIQRDKLFFSKSKRYFKEIADAFAKIPMDKTTSRVKVGVVGEIYVKYSPLGNNNLEHFLQKEGAEVVCPGIIDFFLYCIYANISDYKLYKMKRKLYIPMKIAYKAFKSMQKQLIEAIRSAQIFDVPPTFEHIKALAEEYISTGAQMGEGWLLPAEMLELSERGVNNIVCTQPFGCLPNHIFGKGMMKPLKDKNPHLSIVAIDYDPGATRVNQENRIKLMLTNASMQKDKSVEKPENISNYTEKKEVANRL